MSNFPIFCYFPSILPLFCGILRLKGGAKMDFHIPNLANGTFVPMEVQLREANERELRKKQRRHDFLVTLFSVVASVIAGLITDLLVH